MAYSALAVAVQNRTLEVAPGSTDIASAGSSSAFNVGIAAGALVGGVLVDNTGVRSVALVGGILTALALIVMLAEPWFARGPGEHFAARECDGPMGDGLVGDGPVGDGRVPSCPMPS